MTINFGSQFTQINYRWTQCKSVFLHKNIDAQFYEDNEKYTIYGYDEPDVHICQIWKNEIPYSLLGAYSQEQNDSDKLDFETNYKSTWGKSINKRQPGNKASLVALAGREGSETIYSSHNFCDRT